MVACGSGIGRVATTFSKLTLLFSLVSSSHWFSALIYLILLSCFQLCPDGTLPSNLDYDSYLATSELLICLLTRNHILNAGEMVIDFGVFYGAIIARSLDSEADIYALGYDFTGSHLITCEA
jgi:hypothetical protein